MTLALVIGVTVGVLAAIHKLRRPRPVRRSRHISQETKIKVVARDRARCQECGSTKDLCFDHVIPFSRGGSNSMENIQLLCAPCNSEKSDRI